MFSARAEKTLLATGQKKHLASGGPGEAGIMATDDFVPATDFLSALPDFKEMTRKWPSVLSARAGKHNHLTGPAISFDRPYTTNPGFSCFCPSTKTFVSNDFVRIFDNYKRSCFSAQPRTHCIPNGFIWVLHNCSRSCSAQAGTLDFRGFSWVVLVSQWFCNGSQGESMAWTGEEGRRVFLPTAQNVGIPMVLQGFPLTVVGWSFLPTPKWSLSRGCIGNVSSPMVFQ